MKKILIAIFFSTVIFAQNVSNWQNYSDMKSINDFVIKENIIWAATNGGVFSFHLSDNSFQKFTKSEGLASQSITAIDVDNAGKVWIGTAEGFINVYDPSINKMSTIYQIFQTNYSKKNINDIFIRNDTVYVTTEFGVSLINPENLSFILNIRKFGDFNSQIPVSKIYVNERINVVTQAGLAVNKEGISNLSAPDAWESTPFLTGIPVSKVYDIITYDEKFLFATNKGIIHKEDSTWKTFLYEDKNVYSLHVDGNSLVSLVGNEIHSYNQNDNLIYSLSGNNIKKIIKHRNTYYSSSSNGIIKIKENAANIIKPNAPVSNSMLSLTVDSEGNLWSATGKDAEGMGVMKFDGTKWENINRNNNDAFLTNDFHKVSSSENAVFFSNWGRGFVRLVDTTYQVFNAANTDLVGIPIDRNFIVINGIEEDQNGNVWFLNYWAADKKPISVLSKEGKIYSYGNNSVINSVITVKEIIIDQNNTKWFTGDMGGDVSTRGLYYLNNNNTLENEDDDTWGRLTARNGLRDEDIRAMAIDKYGELILGTRLGVDIIPDPANPNSLRGDQYFSLRSQTINSIIVDPINQKWFATENGIFLVNSDGSVLIANYTKDNSPLPTNFIKSLAIDKEKGIIYAGSDFGVTAITTLFIEPNNDFSDLYVYPNPITLISGSDANLTISGLVEDSQIKILDVTGKVIDEFIALGGKKTNWNCKTSEGEMIATGIYVIVAYNPEADKIGYTKFAVIRK
ncbi:MAG: hypothetical protein CR986_08460 [Ignavibacteriae bacterium]|nr:MAG: hypothetical protein CR986_08460 [Ignavibacteriota bacterium]